MGYGVKIKELLKDRKITIKELSERTGISLNTLYSITKRDSSNVDFSILIKIADSLELDITDVVDSDSTNPSDYIKILNEYDYKQNFRKKNFSNNLNYLIGHYHINLSSLAQEINISKEILEQWVSGEKLPKHNEQRLLESYFHLKENSLIDEVILGIFEDYPNSNDVQISLQNSFARLGLNKEEIESLNEYISFLKSKRPEDIKDMGVMISKMNRDDDE